MQIRRIDTMNDVPRERWTDAMNRWTEGEDRCRVGKGKAAESHSHQKSDAAEW